MNMEMQCRAVSDPREYRRTLGTFTTGITIVTTRDSEGRPVGITVNSFNSVSLDPPLILWSLARGARSFATFSESETWAVHILSAQQERLSHRFATSGKDKFAGIDVESGLGDIPLLKDCCARLQCKTAFRYEAGDHLILVGEVIDFDRSNLPPLVFQAGGYAALLPKFEPLGVAPTRERPRRAGRLMQTRLRKRAGGKKNMQIQFIGHASFSVLARGKRLICDPWLSGKVFNDSWAQVSPPMQVDWSTVDYLWLSHEHPDHFHFPTLKSIPLVDKQRIVVLYQTHTSKRIVDALRKLGFARVTELPLYQWTQLEPDIEVYCGSVGSMDSFLAVRSEGKCILNLNDCVLNPRQLRYIKSALGHVSVLFAQFSIANWVGNDHDEMGGSQKKLDELRWQASIFKPDHIVPFASFVYFCNEENRRMNAWINTPDTIAGQGIPGLHFMYPGDVWNLEKDDAASTNALLRYREDFNAEKAIDPTPPAVPEEQLMKAAQACMTTFTAHYPLQRKRVPILTIHVTDIDKQLNFDPATGVVSMTRHDPAHTCRFAMCSQAAWYMFNFPWGGGTLEVSGMFRDLHRRETGPHPFFFYQNRLSTQFLEFGNFSEGSRTLAFLWRKKWELVYRFMPPLAALDNEVGNTERG